LKLTIDILKGVLSGKLDTGDTYNEAIENSRVILRRQYSYSRV
jgi:hypothetical protein